MSDIIAQAIRLNHEQLLRIEIMRELSAILNKASWLKDEDIRPYVYVRPENHILNPGSRHSDLEWFINCPIIYKNPLELKELEFAEQIYSIETKAFGPANMAMPRWVFYDCAVMPGFVAGFCIRSSRLPQYLKQNLRWSKDCEWTPLSLFIIIPTMAKGDWVAHNLCSVNSFLPKEHQFYALGFLSKAFGLWYANVETCIGMTQWLSPARKLHSHYGPMEVIASYSPVHSHAKTLTYRLKVNTNCWLQFFTKEPDLEFLEEYRPSGLMIEPKNESNLIEIHHKIEEGLGPYFLSATEIANKKIDEPLNLYLPKTILD